MSTSLFVLESLVLLLAAPSVEAACTYGHQYFAEGEAFRAEDGCNSCGCHQGAVLCTERECPTFCSFLGERYSEGESWPLPGSECNLCTCRLAGSFSCTFHDCASPLHGAPPSPGANHWH